MPQPDAKRIQFLACRDLTSAVNDDIQTLTNTGLFRDGDTVEFWDKDANGCLATSLGTRTLTSVCTNAAIVLDSPIDLTTVTGQAVVCNKTLKNAQVALNRLYEQYAQPQNQPYLICPGITATELDVPSIGQARHTITEGADCYEPGDEVDIICDEGLAVDGATVVSVDIGNSKVVIDDNTDLSSFNNCKLCNKTLTVDLAIKRIKNAFTAQPIDGELIGVGDCKNVAFKTANIFVANSTHPHLDGVRLTRGSCGTRASLTNGAGNAEITVTSMILELDGNSVQLKLTDPAASSSPLSVSVTGDYPNFLIDVSLATDGGGAIISTAQQVVDAINADADVQRIMQAQFGGDGTGVQAALAATNLTGGLADATGDYCEVELAANNLIAGTGYQWIIFRIDTDDDNRFDEPPDNTEDILIDYRKAS